MQGTKEVKKTRGRDRRDGAEHDAVITQTGNLILDKRKEFEEVLKSRGRRLPSALRGVEILAFEEDATTPVLEDLPVAAASLGFMCQFIVVKA